jgi:hypothetical protein
MSRKSEVFANKNFDMHFSISKAESLLSCPDVISTLYATEAWISDGALMQLA